MSDSIRLGDVVTIERGTTYKSALIGQPGPVLLGLGSIARHGGFRADSLRTYGGDSPARLLVDPGDIYVSLKDVTQTADLLGAVARVPQTGPVGRLTQDTVRLDVRSADIPVGYLYWVLRTPQYREYCRACATGTTTMGLAREDFFAFEFPRPSADRILLVELLDTLDFKVAANERSLRLVEELADEEFAKSSTATGLDRTTFGEVAEVGGGGTPRTIQSEYWDGDVAWATPTDVTGLTGPYLTRTSRTITDAGLAACASPLYPVGSILMTSRATIGAFAIAQVPVAVNQGFIVANAKDPNMQWWIYHDMRSRVGEFLSHANGATFLELPRGRFKLLPVRLPSAGIAREFAATVGPLHRTAAQLLMENEQLASTRDGLLPLLMSGRIRVKDATRVVEDLV